jgi:hypothetical protein
MARLIDRPSVIQAAGMLVAAALLLAATGGCKQRPRPPTADPQELERAPPQPAAAGPAAALIASGRVISQGAGHECRHG